MHCTKCQASSECLFSVLNNNVQLSDMSATVPKSAKFSTYDVVQDQTYIPVPKKELVKFRKISLISDPPDITSSFILNDNIICLIAFLNVFSTQNGY